MFATQHPFDTTSQPDLIVIWALIIGPPLLIGIILRFVERIVLAIFGDPRGLSREK